MRTYADALRVDAQAQTLLLLTYADVCGRMRTYADALRVDAQAQTLLLLTYADVC
jgi:hypothetical protein